MKKTILFSMIASVAIAICGCQEDNGISTLHKEQSTHRVTLNVTGAETRASIVAVPGGYLSTWNVGDYVTLLEYTPDAEQYDEISEYMSAELQESDIVDGKASFTVELETDEPSDAMYEYISVYGANKNYYMNYLESQDDEGFELWA